METQKDSRGLRTFFEHWNIALIAIVAVLTSQVLDFFTHLCGTPWICFFVTSFSLMIFGGGLIGYAKAPGYRKWSVLHIWSEIGAGKIERIVSLGLATFFVGSLAFTFFVFVETMKLWLNNFWSHPPLTLSAPLRGQRHKSALAHCMVVRS